MSSNYGRTTHFPTNYFPEGYMRLQSRSAKAQGASPRQNSKQAVFGREASSRVASPAGLTSDFCLFCHLERVINLNAETSPGALELGVAQE
jgi:hypothetical protein